MSKITLDDLARMVGNGFNAVDKRFNAMDKRFDAMDKRFDAMDDRFDKLEKENTTDHAAIRAEIAEFRKENESDHSSIHAQLGSIGKELKSMNEKIDNLSKRTFEDSELAFKEIMAMKKRLSFLEKEVEKMKLSH